MGPAGGFLEEGEHPLDAVRRELVEESGLEIEPGDFLGVWMDRYGYDSGATSTLNLYWEARVSRRRGAAGGRRRRSCAGSSRADMPWDELAFECNAKVLSAWLGRNEHA